jgi:ribosomal-protein-alanine N-acetyltransferase
MTAATRRPPWANALHASPATDAQASGVESCEFELRSMTVQMLTQVMRIEAEAYEFPWTSGNFTDSLAAGYEAQVLIGPGERLCGYFVGMMGVEELHLLNLTIAPQDQGRGLGWMLLNAVHDTARALGAHMLWLEVRRSNLRAHRLYERFGFAVVGLRRGYYPAGGGQREDALVMNRRISA